MAKYNREFLVPYLQNVCALHLADKKIDNQLFPLMNRESRLISGVHPIDCPTKPKRYKSIEEDFSRGCALLGIGLGLFFILISLRDISFLTILGWFFVFCGAICAVGTLIMYLKSRKDYLKEMRWYKERLQKNEEAQRYNARVRERELPQVQSAIKKWSRESGRVTSLLKEAYSVNIIPSRYRNIYAAVYLYDWFSTSQADDLDMALNMFVLEEIKEKLDRIIENQMDIILNQRLMLANQQRSLEQQQRHSNMMRAKLNQIAASNEERNTYLRMIESNTAATAYFAAADYIRRI